MQVIIISTLSLQTIVSMTGNFEICPCRY